MIDGSEIFHPQAAEYLKIFRTLFSLTLAFQIAVHFREQLSYFETNPTKIYGAPPRLFGLFRLPALNKNQFKFLGAALIVSLIIVAAGVFPLLFISIALLCYFPYFNSIMSLSYIQRKTNLIPIVLFILLFSSLNSLFGQPTADAWLIILIKICIAQMYFSAGIQKLRRAGFRWVSGKSLQAYLIEHYLWGDTKWAFMLAQFPIICCLLSLLILTFELTFWIIIILPVLTYFYAALGILFHFGILITMRINYLKYLTPVYMIFFAGLILYFKNLLSF